MPSSKIAMFNDLLDYHLNSNVEQGFFFFDLSQLDEIKQVELTFCDCPTDSNLLEITKDFFEGIIALFPFLIQLLPLKLFFKT